MATVADVPPEASASPGTSAVPEKTAVTLSASAEYACYSAGSEQQCWAIANMKAPFYEPTSRAPVDIVAVIDRSGSMAGEKIRLVRETLTFVIEQLKECDRFSLVTYDTNVNMVFDLMNMKEPNKQSAIDSVKHIVSGSSTNLSGGLIKGMEQIALTQSGERAQVQSVLLLTDGLANHGITSKSGIVEEMKKMQDIGIGAVQIPDSRTSPLLLQQAGLPVQQQSTASRMKNLLRKKKAPQQPSPVLQQQSESTSASAVPKIDEKTAGYKFDGTVYTFGFGSDHDSSMLEAISTQGGGVYYYIDSNDKIPECFADCLGGLLSVMGQNLSLKLESMGNNSFKNVHANRNIKWNSPNKSCEIQMGDLQSEEERDIVLELTLPALPGPVEGDPVAKVQLSYFNVITSQMDTVDCKLTVNRTDGERGPGNLAVDMQRNRILTTAVLKEANQLADNNKLEEAQARLKGVIVKLESSLSKDENLVKGLVADLKTCLESMTTQHAYMSKGKLMVTSKMQSHAVQRSNFVDEDDDICSYQSSSKKGYRAMAKRK